MDEKQVTPSIREKRKKKFRQEPAEDAGGFRREVSPSIRERIRKKRKVRLVISRDRPPNPKAKDEPKKETAVVKEEKSGVVKDENNKKEQKVEGKLTAPSDTGTGAASSANSPHPLLLRKDEPKDEKRKNEES